MNALIACPVCFGQSDAPMAIATNMGIFLMLGVVVVMLASFAAFFIYLNRRARLVARSETDEARDRGALRTTERGHYGRTNTFSGTNPQEGTAQC